MEKYEYKIAKLRAGGYIATYHGSPVTGSYSDHQEKVEDWIKVNKQMQQVNQVESESFCKLQRLPNNTNKDSIDQTWDKDPAYQHLHPKLFDDVEKLLNKAKDITDIHLGHVQEIVIANILISVYNTHHITTDKARIVYRKKD